MQNTQNTGHSADPSQDCDNYLHGVTNIKDIILTDEVNVDDWVFIVNNLLERAASLEKRNNELIKEQSLKDIETQANLERANSLAQRYLTKLRKVDPKYFADLAGMVCDNITGFSRSPEAPIISTALRKVGQTSMNSGRHIMAVFEQIDEEGNKAA